MEAIPGRCLCGAVTFELTPPTDFCAHCHCGSCRGASGAAFLTWTSVPRERFTLLQGEDALTWFASSETIRWGFCSRCGSTLLYEAIASGHPEAPKLDRMYVTLGALRAPLDRQPACHVSVEEAVTWFRRADHLPGHVGKTEQTQDVPSAHLILYVADQAASTRFYAAVLAAPPRLDVPGMSEFALPGNAVLGLMPESGVARLFEGAVSTNAPGAARAELYLRVEDPGAAHARALAAGATELSPLQRRDWGHDAAYSLDPDGHVLAFANC
ncbi:MAG: GFA family protein [Polyangiaceae bacterium]